MRLRLNTHSNPMKTDKLFYQVFPEHPALAFELAGLPLPPDGAYRQRSIEVKETSFRLDEAEVPKAARELSERLDERPSSFDLRQVLELIEIFVVYKLPQLSLEGIRAMLNFNDISLQETAFYKDVFGKGHLEGCQEGRQDEAAQLVLRQLKRRHGATAEGYARRLADLSLFQLEQLSLDLLDFQGLADLETWLESPPRHPGKQGIKMRIRVDIDSLAQSIRN